MQALRLKSFAPFCPMSVKFPFLPCAVLFAACFTCVKKQGAYWSENGLKPQNRMKKEKQMAKSVIEICNNALQDLGEDLIMSLNDECKAARLCNQRWAGVRDAVLRAHVWKCCSGQAELAAVGGLSGWRWESRFALPTDCLRVVRVAGSGGAEVVRWEVQGRVILCNEAAPVFIAYVRREIDPKQYDSLLSEALSARLAACLAYPLSGSTSLSETFWRIYQEKLSEARGIDAREGLAETVCSAGWLGAKLGG